METIELMGIVKGLIEAGEYKLAGEILLRMVRAERELKDIEKYIRKISVK